MLGFEAQGHLTDEAQVGREKRKQVSEGYDATFWVALGMCITCGITMSQSFAAAARAAVWAEAAAVGALATMGFGLACLILRQSRSCREIRERPGERGL